MSLFEKLLSLEAEKKSIRVALIGAGKFVTMYLAQIPKTPGIEIAAIIDINVDNVRSGKVLLNKSLSLTNMITFA